MVSSFTLAGPLGMDSLQVRHAAIYKPPVGIEEALAGLNILAPQVGMGIQFGWYVEGICVHHLVAGGLLGVRSQPVVLQSVAGEAGYVLDREVQYGVLGNGGVPVTQHPALVKVGGLFLADLPGDLIKCLGSARGHGEGYCNLFFAEQSSVQRVDPSGVGMLPGGAGSRNDHWLSHSLHTTHFAAFHILRRCNGSVKRR